MTKHDISSLFRNAIVPDRDTPHDLPDIGEDPYEVAESDEPITLSCESGVIEPQDDDGADEVTVRIDGSVTAVSEFFKQLFRR